MRRVGSERWVRDVACRSCDVPRTERREVGRRSREMCVFFFFQAEDGIRDLTVTGVQTCALPILVRGISSVLAESPLQLWLAMAQSPAERRRIEHHLTNQHVDGVMLLSLHDADQIGRASCRERV